MNVCSFLDVISEMKVGITEVVREQNGAVDNKGKENKYSYDYFHKAPNI